MRAPRWLRTIARRKSGAKADAESAAGLAEFATGGLISGPKEKGDDSVPLALGYGHAGISPGARRIPSFSQRPAKPVPAFAPRHTYGGKGTIHRTATVDIQIDKITGEVHAVWFRCLQLPFTVSEVRNDISSNPIDNMAIEEITYVELPGEESSQ
jgi:hypothetical protein